MMFKLVVLPSPPARVGLIALKALVYEIKTPLIAHILSIHYTSILFIRITSKNYDNYIFPNSQYIVFSVNNLFGVYICAILKK